MVKYTFCLLLLLATSPAYACAVLEKANPAVGSTVAGPVDTVTLTFSGKIYPKPSTLEVFDALGHKVSMGKPYGKDGDDTFFATKVSPLPAGKYKVQWSTLCDCGSFTPGSYKFTVQ